MRKITAWALLVPLLLSGCVAISRVPAGPMAVGKAEVTLGRDWSDISKIMPGRPKNVRLLSHDGPMLNRLYLSDALSPGDVLIRPTAKEKPTPVIRAKMTSAERMEFVADSVAAMDYQRVEIARPRPATFGGKTAVRFDLTARTSDGLDVRGTALTAEIEGKTYVVLYLAPAEHYFDADLAEVEAIMTSARPKS